MKQQFHLKRRSAIALLLGVFLVSSTASALDELEGSGLTREQEMELEYADRLLAVGLADYSRQILEKLDLPPEIMDIRKIRSLTAIGEFEEAEALVAQRDMSTEAAMTLQLALADGYYAWGRYDQARKLYDGFFKKFPEGPGPELQLFFLSSAYKYAQMMQMTGNDKAAADAYRLALKAKPERHIQRQLQSELAEVLLRMAQNAGGAARQALLAELQKIVDDILWVQDVWFGRGIVMLAHMRKMEDNIDGAMSLVDDYSNQLRSIDRALREESEATGEDLTKLSPMAQCRYMIGTIMHDEAVRILEEGGDRDRALELLIGEQDGNRRRSGALQHFLNVFVRYPNTSWAPDSGNRFRQVEEMLKRVWDKQVRARITPEQWQEVETAQFREARSLFNQQRFEEAARNYEQVLTLFPEQETSVAAMGELAACYIELNELTMADTVVRHLAERFNRHEKLSAKAGDQIIRIAFKFTEMNKPSKMQETYATFFEFFENHPRTVVELYRFAEEAYREENWDRALAYYRRIVEDHEGHPVYFDAFNRLTMVLHRQGNTREEVRALNALIRTLEEKDPRGHMLVNAMYRLATALRSMGPRYLDTATAVFKKIEDLLKDEATRVAYQENEQEAKANRAMLQGAMFYQALADAMRTEVPERIQKAFDQRAGRTVPPETILNSYYKAGAVRRLLELADLFPDSDFAPIALSQAGTLNTVIGREDEARQTLQRLQREYPNSTEAANAVFMIGRNLLELGRRDQAVDYFKRMFSGDGNFSAGQILTAARELQDAGEYEIAIEAYDLLISTETERALLEPARVGKGQALMAQERYRDALTVLEKLLEDYPTSGYTVEISKSASQAYAAVAMETADEQERFTLFNKAVDVMNRARRFSNDQGLRAELDVGVARILERKASAERRFGTDAKANDYRNEAVAAYQTVMMFQDPNHPEVAPHLQDAYARCLPLMLEMERWDDVLADAQQYLALFPEGKHVVSVRQALNRARVAGGAARGDVDNAAPDLPDDEPLL